MYGKKFKEIIGIFLRFSGISFLIRNIFCRDKVTIIFYHDPNPDTFKTHIRYLSKHYNFISLNKLIDAIYRRKWSTISKKSIIITFDDGHKGNYYLLDLFKKYRLNPTIYLCSHLINTRRNFWFLLNLKKPRSIKKHKNENRLKILKEQYGYEPNKEYPEREALNLKEIKEMSPYVDFQCHSKFHPILTACDDEESREEITGSKIYLEKLLQKKIDHFSYPNGDYSQREVEFLKEGDYMSSRSYDIGWNHDQTDPFRLKAMAVDDEASINVLCAQICGFFRYFNYFLHGKWNGKHPPFV